MKELEVDVCVLTETWLRKDPNIEQALEDFQDINNYEFIRKDRQDCRHGGGVAICFDRSKYP